VDDPDDDDTYARTSACEGSRRASTTVLLCDDARARVTRRIRGRTTPRGIHSFIHSLIRERVRVGSGVIGRGQNLIESVYATDANDANGDVWDDFGGGIVVVVVGETVEGWCGVDVGGGARTRDDVDETFQGRRVDRFRVVGFF
jgi:hypothetical protein